MKSKNCDYILEEIEVVKAEIVSDIELMKIIAEKVAIKLVSDNERLEHKKLKLKSLEKIAKDLTCRIKGKKIKVPEKLYESSGYRE